MEEKFNRIVSDIFKIPPAKIKDTLTAKDIADWDSMNYLMFIAELEKEFRISFNMDEVLNADSLRAIKIILKSKGVDI